MRKMKMSLGSWRAMCGALTLLLIGCDVTETKDTDSYLKLPEFDSSLPNKNAIDFENQLASAVGFEIWKGKNFEYNPNTRAIRAERLEKVNYLKADARTTVPLNYSDVADFLIVAGIKKNDEYEYLTHGVFPGMTNGTAVRLSPSGIESFYRSACLKNRAADTVSATTGVTNIVLTAARASEGMWVPVKTVLNPVGELLKTAQKLLEEQVALQDTSLLNWTATDGSYRYTETNGKTVLVLTANVLWGENSLGEAPGSLIAADIHKADSYFTNLAISRDVVAGELVFTFTQAGPLAPLLGVPKNATSPYRVNAVSWVNEVVKQYQTMEVKIVMDMAYSDSSDTLKSQLVYQGRSSFAVTKTLAGNGFTVSQNPIEFHFVAAETSGARPSRAQTLAFDEWKLKVFPESNGAKGSVKFTAKGDANFDFAGQVAHTSDAGTADKVFLQCIADGSPLPFTVP